jgi:selenide, water dikinase
VIVGLDRADDAGVYRVSDEIAIIQTVDFFTPIVDDPYWFGQIAAANALSDVYAMGGVPKTAMNLVAFPIKQLGINVLRKVLQGGLDKMKEADVALVGGHSVEDAELKYGLSVTGFIHPDRILTKKNLKPGDQLILTKPLGTGIINTAIKRGQASDDVVDRVTRQMATLNRDAARIMEHYRVNACTDITGFGLLGHLAEMVEKSGCGIQINAEAVPVIPETFDYAEKGLIPGGCKKNREFRQHMVDFVSSIGNSFQDILFDPQTSGGLMIAVELEDAADLLADLRKNGMVEADVVGEVLAEPVHRIIVN